MGTGQSHRRFLAWQASWIWIPAMIPMLTFFPLLFPSGRPPSRRWRPVVWIAAASIPFSFVGEALPSRRFEDYPVDNPFGIGPAAEVAGGVGFILDGRRCPAPWPPWWFASVAPTGSSASS